MGQKSLLLSLLIVIVFSHVTLAQSGRIEGTVTEAETNEPMPGVNVVIEGTTQGDQTNMEGYYSIGNVSAGEYTLRATMIGFAPVVIQNVEVNIDQVTTIDFEIREQVIEGEEIVVQAVMPVVQRDVSSSRSNISRQDIENLPISTISEAIGLQAGVQGLSVRGGSADELGFSLNGLTLRDERDNTPFTGISLSSVENIQVQTGGFNAEYGNIRSGLIQVTTKEGNRDRYTVDAITRIRPPQSKHFGPEANDPNSYWIRPYIDDDVAWTGTASGAWDKYTQNNYDDFVGWIEIADQLAADGDPTTDMTPEAAQQAFLWQHRKEIGISEPDYEVDMNIGGPFPIVSSELGDLRFSASYRESRNQYMIPLNTSRYLERTFQLKMTSNIGTGMKLSIEGLYGSQSGTNNNNSGLPGMFTSAQSQATQMEQVSFIRSRIFSTDYWAPSKRTLSNVGAQFTHSLSSNTYYEISFNRVESKYDTNPGRPRNTDPVINFGGVGFDEAPFGFYSQLSNGIGSGMRMGIGMSTSRDSSSVATYSGRIDLTSQINRYNQVKAGIELVNTTHNVNYARIDEGLQTANVISRWTNSPIRGAAYVQNRIEFRGMIANLGLRLDYSNPRGDWFDFDEFSNVLGNVDALNEILGETQPDVQLNLSPRMGVSFPITEDSKLFFNYGHFYSMPQPENLFMIRRAPFFNNVSRLANPNNPLPKTVAYELGYEHNLLDLFLVRVSGYYRDTSQQPAQVRYTGFGGLPNYTISQPVSYQDIRGAEFTIRKVAGRYIRGEFNYTYSITSGGLFGTLVNFQNPQDQRDYERENTDNDQFRPVPTPYARLYMDLLAPRDFGPEINGFHPFGNWVLSTIGRWQNGTYFTWSGGGSAVPGIANNVKWSDFWMLDMRLSRRFDLGSNRTINFFVDASNVLNLRRMNFFTNAGFVVGDDYLRYMRSLHMPYDIVDEYANADNMYTGSDRPGDYRKPGVEFVPIESYNSLDAVQDPNGRALYWIPSEETFYQYIDGQYVQADQEFVNQVLDDKAYIDMPGQDFFTFFNPRAFQFGFRVSF
ncbi:hypothetical protein BH23BAC3_BH23BAC3_05010 [soil metagenome]